MAIFLLTAGDYNYAKNLMVTTDVRVVAKAYANIVRDGGYGFMYSKPYIEIRIDGEMEEYPTVFAEKIKQEQRLVKYLSKLAWELENNPGT